MRGRSGTVSACHPGRPVALASWRVQPLATKGDDALDDRRIELGDPRRPRLVAQKPLEALGCETLLPAPDASLGLAGLAHDRVRADALGRQKHDLSSPDMLLRCVAVFDQRVKPIKVGGRGQASPAQPARTIAEPAQTGRPASSDGALRNSETVRKSGGSSPTMLMKSAVRCAHCCSAANSQSAARVPNVADQHRRCSAVGPIRKDHWAFDPEFCPARAAVR
jgi:hypothetical protein